MMRNPTGRVGSQGVNEGLRQGYRARLADNCDNYHAVYYNLMLNIRLDTVC